MAEGGYTPDPQSTIQDVRNICSICLEIIRVPRSLPCGHGFCALCLLGYVEKCLTTESSDDFACPLCRAEIRVSNYKMSAEKGDISKLDLLSFSHIHARNETESTCKVDDRCQPCKRGKEHVVGEYFCKECDERICTDCVTHHSRNKLTCNHTVTKIKTEEQTKRDDLACDFQTKCDLHAKKKFKYICIDHNMLCCSKCVIEGDHRKCSNVKSLKEFRQSNDYDVMVHKVKDMTENMSKDIGGLKQQQLKCISDVADKTSCFMKTTRSLEKEMLLEVSKQIHIQRSPVLEKLKIFKEKSAEAVHTLEGIDMRTQQNTIRLNHVDETYDAINSVSVLCGIFKNMESEENLVRELTKTLESTTPNITIEIKQISKNFVETLRRVSHRLTFDKCHLIGHAGQQRPILRKQLPKKEKINSVIILQNGNVVIADETTSLSVLASNLDDIKKIDMSSQPTGITECNPNSIAVALPAVKRLAIVRFNGNSHSANEFKIAIAVTCLASGTLKGDRVILIYEPETRSIHQQIIRSFFSKEFKHFARNFPNVHKISFHDNAEMVFVLQKGIDVITGLDFEGRRKFVFTHRQLHTPIGMFLHNTDKLYVCCYGTKQINEITLTTREMNDVLCSFEGLKGPMTVAFDKALTKCLVYDSDKGKELKFFDM